MKVFLKSLGRDVSLAIENEFKESNYKTEPWPENVANAFEANDKAINALMQSLNDDDSPIIINCESAYEI